jgi:uncharacterized repeat protein (TIGR04138 family)
MRAEATSATMIDKDERILALVKKHGRYAAEAYAFVFEALDYTLRKRGGARRHVSGPEIMDGVRSLALETFGFLARDVLARWGVTTTADFGEIVFHLISDDLLQKTADDRQEDFAGLFDFSEAFDGAFEQTLASVEI